MNYIYALYCNDQKLDQTALSEENMELARYLLMDEFGWEKKLIPEQLDTASIVFEGAEEEIDDYKYSTEVHPKKLRLCSARTENPEDLEDLKSCPDFALPPDHEDDDPNVYCTHCWAQGWLSVCMNAKAEEEE